MAGVAVRAFLSGIIDYAGLFPPADLPLEAAWTTYVGHLAEPEGWLLGRFVCPAARLSELAERIRSEPPPRRPVGISVLGRGAAEMQPFLAAVRSDAADMAAFARELPDLARPEAYEVKLPEKAFDRAKPNHLRAALATAAFLLDSQVPCPLAPFFESPWVDKQAYLHLLQALHDDQETPEARQRTRCGPLGCKLRTGGLQPAAVPPIELVAAVLAGCAAARIPFKATAGLHHPFRHFDAGLNTRAHGFVNVFLAGILLSQDRFPLEELPPLLDDAAPESFGTEPPSWRGHAVDPKDIDAARTLFTSFGSCSFSEPHDDLKEAGWL